MGYYVLIISKLSIKKLMVEVKSEKGLNVNLFLADLSL